MGCGADLCKSCVFPVGQRGHSGHQFTVVVAVLGKHAVAPTGAVVEVQYRIMRVFLGVERGDQRVHVFAGLAAGKAPEPGEKVQALTHDGGVDIDRTQGQARVGEVVPRRGDLLPGWSGRVGGVCVDQCGKDIVLQLQQELEKWSLS